MQHLLNKAVWDTDAVAADLREYVIEHLGEADGVQVADETGDPKKGERTVGVQRQYTGTAGRIEELGWAMCWPSAATAASTLTVDRCGPMTSPPHCPRIAGSGTRPGPARRARGFTTGPGSP
jgi:hypothetical protein